MKDFAPVSLVGSNFLALPEVIQKMNLYGLEAHTESPEFFSDTIRRDFSKWGKLISDIDFKPI